MKKNRLSPSSLLPLVAAFAMLTSLAQADNVLIPAGARNDRGTEISAPSVIVHQNMAPAKKMLRCKDGSLQVDKAGACSQHNQP